MTSTVPLRDGVSIFVKRSGKAGSTTMASTPGCRPRSLTREARAPELKPLLEGLAQATGALRAANFAEASPLSRSHGPAHRGGW